MEIPYRCYSLGDYWHFIFETTGIWSFSENKKTLQKKLKRLASEDTYTLNSVPELKEELYELFNENFGNKEISGLLLSFFDEIASVYINIVRNFIMPCNKEDTIIQIVGNSGVSLLALNVNKLVIKLNKQSMPFEVNIDWFLPEFGSGTVSEYPLQKVIVRLRNMLLINTNITSVFGDFFTESVRQYLYRLEKGAGEKRPQYLFDNIEPFIKFPEYPEITNYLKFIIAVSCALDKICRRFKDKENLEVLISEFKRQYYLQKSMLSSGYAKIDQQKMSLKEWHNVVDLLSLKFLSHAESFSYCITRTNPPERFDYARKLYSNEAAMKKYCELYGESVVYFSEWALTNHNNIIVPDSLSALFSDEERLLNKLYSKTNLEEIETEISTFSSKHDIWLKRLPWIMFELRSDIAHYRQDKTQAKDLILEAFEHGKYSAGAGLKRIIQRALDLCVLCSDRKSFNNVYKWGIFSGYIDSGENSNLDNIFDKFKQYYCPNGD